MVISLTDANFDSVVIKSTKPVVIDFFAQWCGPCRQMAPHFAQLSEELKESYVFAKVDVDEENGLSINHGITALPTLVFYKNGRQVGSIRGALSAQELREKLITVFGQ